MQQGDKTYILFISSMKCIDMHKGLDCLYLGGLKSQTDVWANEVTFTWKKKKHFLCLAVCKDILALKAIVQFVESEVLCKG